MPEGYEGGFILIGIGPSLRQEWHRGGDRVSSEGPWTAPRARPSAGPAIGTLGRRIRALALALIKLGGVFHRDGAGIAEHALCKA